ncbi:MAG: hypothetical protein CME61_06885 [Halobacteriovoraceae bacterium]|nr:hypothetical protein [Halobacteriovoraceae bacterium]|tara:strand:- start:445 stop:675 length:231 start_codon:yes stop_codon:yes gene_type:complete
MNLKIILNLVGALSKLKPLVIKQGQTSIRSLIAGILFFISMIGVVSIFEEHEIEEAVDLTEELIEKFQPLGNNPPE